MNIAGMKLCPLCLKKKIQIKNKRCRKCYFQLRVGHKHSEETKKKIGDANRGNSACAFYKGKKMPKWICKKISMARKGIIFTKEHCKNIGKAQLGKPKYSLRGENAYNWNGGKKINSAGYVMILIPEENRINGKRYVYEHRFVMEKFLGRKLREEEVIHHINKNPSDNRIKNLQLFNSNLEHMEKCHQKRPRRK